MSFAIKIWQIGVGYFLLFLRTDSAVARGFQILNSENFVELIKKLAGWLNANQGILTSIIFISTMIFGWVSGIFAALRRRPQLKVRLIDGPTFSCTFFTGSKDGDFDVHRTGVALYLQISNSGNAPASIDAIEVGYHWHLRPFSINWLKYRVGWFWLVNQSVALADFQVKIGESTKVFPFMTQINNLSSARPSTYLRVGESTNGVVYFEQSESWGGCFPSASHGFTKIKLRLRDAHGNRYDSKHEIQVVTLDEARKYNPRFGETHEELRGEFLPIHEEIITTEKDRQAPD